MRAALFGFGAVGSRVARLLASSADVDSLVVVHRDPRRVEEAAAAMGSKVELVHGSPDEAPDADVTVVALPSGTEQATRAALRRGSHVVSVNDDPSEVKALLSLDRDAHKRELAVAVGAALAPGLSCVLAAYMASSFERVDEVHVARVGTGGPACARRRHVALTSTAANWEDGDWHRRPGGSGRELLWFPEPVGGADCYRASLADPLLLVPAFSSARRVTARVEATRRDRLTSRLPMLRPPHPEGLLGAVRTEIRGWRAGRAETAIMGVAVRPALGAAAVAAQTARWAAAGRLTRAGSGGLAELVKEPAHFLRELSEVGITVSSFEGLAIEA